jgi:GDP-D-mannose 3', 5'-epimerase
VRIARFHNIFGPEGTWAGGREKAPAALCRKVAEQEDGGEIEMWGDGEQTRSFLYIDECVEAVQRLMRSKFAGIREKLGWEPTMRLREGLARTYKWIDAQVHATAAASYDA